MRVNTHVYREVWFYVIQEIYGKKHKSLSALDRHVVHIECVAKSEGDSTMHQQARKAMELATARLVLQRLCE